MTRYLRTSTPAMTAASLLLLLRAADTEHCPGFYRT